MGTIASIPSEIENLLHIANTVEGEDAEDFTYVLMFLKKYGENLLRKDKSTNWQNINMSKSTFQTNIRSDDMVQLLSAGLQEMGYEEFGAQHLTFPMGKRIDAMAANGILRTVEESLNILSDRGVRTVQEKRRESPAVVPKSSERIRSDRRGLSKCEECGTIQTFDGGIFCERCNAFLHSNQPPEEPSASVPGTVGPTPLRKPSAKSPERKSRSSESEKPSTSEEPLSDSWSCEACTFINEDPISPRCQVCDSHRNSPAAGSHTIIILEDTEETANGESSPVKEFWKVLTDVKEFDSNLSKEDKSPTRRRIDLEKPVFRKNIRNKNMNIFELFAAGLQQLEDTATSITGMLFHDDCENVPAVNYADNAVNILQTKCSGTNQEKRRELKMCAICKRSHALLICHECDDMLMCQPCEKQRHEALKHHAELIEGNKGVHQLLLQSVRNKELSQHTALTDHSNPGAVVSFGLVNASKKPPQSKPDESMNEVDSLCENDGEPFPRKEAYGPAPSVMKLSMPQVDNTVAVLQQQIEKKEEEYRILGEMLSEVVGGDMDVYIRLLDRFDLLKREMELLKKQQQRQQEREQRTVSAFAAITGHPQESVEREFEETTRENQQIGHLLPNAAFANPPTNPVLNGSMDWTPLLKRAEVVFESMIPISPFKHKYASSPSGLLEPEREPSKRLRTSTSGDITTWSCQFCTFNNSPTSNICEMCAKSRESENISEPLAVSAQGSLIAPRPVEVLNETMVETLQLIDQSEPKLRDLYARAITVTIAAVNPKKKLEAVNRTLDQFRIQAQMDISTTEMLTSYIEANGDSRRAYYLLLETRAEKMVEFSAQYPDVPAETIHQLLTECDGNVRDAMNKYTLDDLEDEVEVEFLSVSKAMGPDIRNRLRLILQHDKHMANSEVDFIFKLVDASPVELTIDEVIDIARNSYFDLERGKELLNHDCSVCFGMFPYTRIRTLFFCECNICLECFTSWLETVIRERSVRQWACPSCDKPDLNRLEDASTHYQLLDTVVRQLLPDLYDMFTNKLFDYATCEDPNFRYCAHCTKGFVYQGDQQHKIRCPYCSQYMCYTCKRQWRDQHEGVSCEDFSRWEKENDPDYQKQHLDNIINQTGIKCPKCQQQFEMAVGGCAHFTCSQCKFQFCEGCKHEIIAKGKMSPQCNERCTTRGLHAHHPRHCLTLTRDFTTENLQKLLDMHNVPFEKTISLGVVSCTEIVQAEGTMPDGSMQLVDGPCGAAVAENQAGLCEKHYKLKLCKLIYKSKLDPVDIMETYEITAWFQGEYPGVEVPDEQPELIKLMKEKYSLK